MRVLQVFSAFRQSYAKMPAGVKIIERIQLGIVILASASEGWHLESVLAEKPFALNVTDAASRGELLNSHRSEPRN